MFEAFFGQFLAFLLGALPQFFSGLMDFLGSFITPT